MQLCGHPPGGVTLRRNWVECSARRSSPTTRTGCGHRPGRSHGRGWVPRFPAISSGDVSGHGWWKKGDCTANTAHVFNCLCEWYTDGTWRPKACSPTKQLRPYTGSGDRTVAGATCNSTAQTIFWRNHVDVEGQIDTSEQPYNQITSTAWSTEPRPPRRGRSVTRASQTSVILDD